ncbi:hypothetical protein ETH_00037040, partial [Eimeria tenella]
DTCRMVLVGSDLVVRLDGRAWVCMFSGEWESEGGLFAVVDLLVCGCV